MADLPHTCPLCGEKFGWGAAAPLLSVVNSAPFDENLPCCGVRVKGTVDRTKIIELTVVSARGEGNHE